MYRSAIISHCILPQFSLKLLFGLHVHVVRWRGQGVAMRAPVAYIFNRGKCYGGASPRCPHGFYATVYVLHICGYVSLM